MLSSGSSGSSSDPFVVLLGETVEELILPRVNSLLVKLQGLLFIWGAERVEKAEKGVKLKRWNINLISSRDFRVAPVSGPCKKKNRNKLAAVIVYITVFKMIPDIAMEGEPHIQL